MKDRYFELNSNIKTNNPEFITFVEKLVSCMENRNLTLQKDMNYFQNSYMLTGLDSSKHIQISEESYQKTKKILNFLGGENNLISCSNHFNDFIIELFKEYKNTIFGLGCNILFHSLQGKKSKFLKEFFKKFDVDIIKSSLNLTYYMNLKRLNKPEITFDSVNGLIKDIKEGNGQKTDYYIADKISSENLMRLEIGEPLKFPYNKSTIKEKYILLKSLIHVNEKENLPSNTIRKIIENLENVDYITTFNYYYYNLICKYKKVENFQYSEHLSLDESLSFAIELEERDIRGYLIKSVNKFYICYENKDKLNPTNKTEENKKKIIKKIEQLTSKDYMYNQYSLSELINIQIFNNKPILESSNKIYDEKAIPLELLLNKGMNIYNLTGNLLDFFDKKYLKYNRSNFNLNGEINVELLEKIDNYYTIIINFEEIKITYDRDFYIPEKIEDYRSGIIKSIRKGYLLTDTGIVRYITTSELKLIDIKFPNWFVSETKEEFLFLLYFFQSL